MPAIWQWMRCGQRWGNWRETNCEPGFVLSHVSKSRRRAPEIVLARSTRNLILRRLRIFGVGSVLFRRVHAGAGEIVRYGDIFDAVGVRAEDVACVAGDRCVEEQADKLVAREKRVAVPAFVFWRDGP